MKLVLFQCFNYLLEMGSADIILENMENINGFLIKKYRRYGTRILYYFIYWMPIVF